MAYRVPYLRVIGPGGENMLGAWGSRLIGVRLIDRQDNEADEAIFRFTRKPPYMAIPGEGTPYTVQAGWSRASMAIAGIYTFQRTHLFGDPRKGQELHLICRAGDLIDHLKRVDSAHYDAENGHKTLGDVFRTLFKSGGKAIEIHPDIDKLPIPSGYGLRWNQSSMDYAIDIAENAGALVKPSGDKMIVLKRGSGESASGRTLPTITVPFDENYGFDVELEPRFKYTSTAASYLDTGKGRLEREQQSSGGQGAGNALPHPFGSQEAAKTAAAAMAAEFGRFAGQGLFTKAGDPSAVSGAPVKCTGFGTPIDETEWEAATVTNDIVPDQVWTTTIETEVKA